MSEIRLPTTITNQTLSLTKVTAALPKLQLGDQFQATVLSNIGGKAQLQLPQGTVSAKTDLPLHAGQQLKLTVAQMQPQVTLSISKPSANPADALSQKVYPKQQPLPQALQNLGQLMQSQTTGKGAQTAIQQLLLQLPTITQLFNPQQVKSQVSKSGTFMENNLLQNKAGALQGDLKMQLLQMKAQLMTQPEQKKALQQVESMIARIELNQLKSTQSQSRGQPAPQQDPASAKEPLQRSWQVEIPVMVDQSPEQIALKFRQQADTEDPEKQRWHIELNLTPPEMGEMEIHAIYHHDTLDIHFVTEREETSQLISEQLETLQAALSSAGLETGTLFSRQKSIHDAPSTPTISTGFSIKA